jgi:hypothetical protein
MNKYKYYIGIDPGVQTGYALWDSNQKKILDTNTSMIHLVMEDVKFAHNFFNKEVFVRIEDARKRKWFGIAGREKLQGAGSIKRDCSIWEDYLKGLAIPFELVAPKNNKTKISEYYFTKITGYTKRTSAHARDAAMLVVGL